jgi:ribosomal protein L24E
MGKRRKRVKSSSQIIRYLYCSYCGESVSPQNVVWVWKEGPVMYCSDKCSKMLDKKEE